MSSSKSLFPDLPRESILDKDRSNGISEFWDLYFSQNSEALQTNFTNEGLRVPQLTSAQMATIQGLYNPTYIGQPYETLVAHLPDITSKMVFDSTHQLPNIFIITVSGGNVTGARWWAFSIT